MFDLGWTELLVIGIVALIVVGPKDLPVLFRNVGRFVGKAKGMAREFSSAMHEAAEDSGLHDVAKSVKSASDPMNSVMGGIKDAARDLTDSVNPSKLERGKHKPGSETAKLSEDRAEKARKIQAATARAAADRLKREAAEAQAKAEAAEAALSETPDSKT